MRARLALAMVLASLAAPARGFEEYAQRELLSCDSCHASRDDRAVLNDRGIEYRLNGYTFPVRPGPADPGPEPTPLMTPLPRGRPRSLAGHAARATAVLEETAGSLAEGRYSRATEGAARLQNLAGMIEGELRGSRSGLADLARNLRDAAFRLERTLRVMGPRRAELAPVHLMHVLKSCLACHTAAGLAEDDWKLAGANEPRAGTRHATPLPARERSPGGERR